MIFPVKLQEGLLAYIRPHWSFENMVPPINIFQPAHFTMFFYPLLTLNVYFNCLICVWSSILFVYHLPAVHICLVLVHHIDT